MCIIAGFKNNASPRTNCMTYTKNKIKEIKGGCSGGYIAGSKAID
jgi:hypothetical protein